MKTPQASGRNLGLALVPPWRNGKRAGLKPQCLRTYRFDSCRWYYGLPKMKCIDCKDEKGTRKLPNGLRVCQECHRLRNPSWKFNVVRRALRDQGKVMSNKWVKHLISSGTIDVIERAGEQLEIVKPSHSGEKGNTEGLNPSAG